MCLNLTQTCLKGSLLHPLVSLDAEYPFRWREVIKKKKEKKKKEEVQ